MEKVFFRRFCARTSIFRFSDFRSKPEQDITNTTSNVLIAPGVGFQTPLTKKIALDLSARFEIVQDSKYIGVRAGFTLPVGSREE